MSELNELLTNDNVNVWVMFEDGTHKQALQEIVKAASGDDLKRLIVKFDDHQLFGFLEDFICDGNSENMSEEQYWDFIDEAGL